MALLIGAGRQRISDEHIKPRRGRTESKGGLLIDQATSVCLIESVRSSIQILCEETDSSEADRDIIKHNCDRKLSMKVYYEQGETDIISLTYANVNLSIEIF